MKLQIGAPAPDFCLPDQNNKTHCLTDYQGQKVILYFYPKDDTPGCTTEACDFRDNLIQFQNLKVPILGVSVDSVARHQKFALKYHLNFPILADTDKIVVNQYQVWALKKFMGREYYGTLRTTFVIDEQGKIKHIYENVKPLNHAADILQDLK